MSGSFGGDGGWGMGEGEVGGVPAIGGKRMAIRPRNMSLLHMVMRFEVDERS